MSYTCAINLQIADGSLGIDGCESNEGLESGTRQAIVKVKSYGKLPALGYQPLLLLAIRNRRLGLTYFRAGIGQTGVTR